MVTSSKISSAVAVKDNKENTMSKETSVVKEFSNVLSAQPVSTHQPSHRTPIKKLKKLKFLRKENLLPPAHPSYIPPTAYQIRDLATWAGISGGGRQGVEKLARAAKVEAFQVKRWTNINKTVEECPTIPSPVWQYMLIRLGVVEQVAFRRSEPESFVKETFTPQEEKSPITLRAKIWYSRDDVVIDFYDDSISSQSRKDNLPIFSLTFDHEKSAHGNSIGGKLRHDSPDSRQWEPVVAAIVQAVKQQRLRAEHVEFYFSFFNTKVWKALWEVHDFNSISPRDFLNNQNLDPFKCKDEDLPTHRELLSFCKWAGIHRNELAYICGESPRRLAYLSSGKGEEKLKQAITEHKEGKISTKDLASIRWASVISRHAWALMLSAFGLAPSIEVLGRQAPEPRKVRTFELASVANVPTRFVKIETLFSFNNPAKTELSITGCVNTHQQKGEDWVETFTISVNTDNEIFVDDVLCGDQEQLPKSWAKLTDRVPEIAQSYMNKALWFSLSKYLHFHLDTLNN